MTAVPYDPRSDIDARADVVLAFDAVAGLMGGGLHARRGSIGVIIIDPALEGADRREVMTHELVHHERGDGLTDSLADGEAPVGLTFLRDRAERAVDDEVARRLVPADQLVVVVGQADDDSTGIGPEEVADHFEVPFHVARRALEQLAVTDGARRTRRW